MLIKQCLSAVKKECILCALILTDNKVLIKSYCIMSIDITIGNFGLWDVLYSVLISNE